MNALAAKAGLAVLEAQMRRALWMRAGAVAGVAAAAAALVKPLP